MADAAPGSAAVATRQPAAGEPPRLAAMPERPAPAGPVRVHARGGGGAAMPAEAGAAPEGGGQRGRGGAPAGPGGTASAVQGLNRATWTNLRFPARTPCRGPVVMWGGGAGPLTGPRVPPGVYTVKVSSGSLVGDRRRSG